MKKQILKSVALGLAIAATVSLSACGSRSKATTGTNNPLVTNSPIPSTNDGNIYGLTPAPTALFNITGDTGPARSWSAGSAFNSETKLRIKISALPAPNLTVQNYQNWVIAYGCLSVQVTVNGTTQTTGILKVPGMPTSPTCANAPESKILDFSSIMTGNGPVSISVHHAQYDNCRSPNTYQYGCAMSQVWMNHVVAGTITIETNDTYMAP